MALFAEMRRRNVFKVALLYAALSWLVVWFVGAVQSEVTVPVWTETFMYFVLIFAPFLAADGDGALMTWWERLPDPEGERRHRLMFARYESGWSEPSVVTEGEEYFANWADVPSVVREPSGNLLAHWLAKTGSATYAYSIFLSRSIDGGATWQPLGKLNDDATDTEHGFVALLRCLR